MKTKKLEALVALGATALQSDPIRKVLFGTYIDGSIRTYADAINGEFISPKDRARMEKKAYKKRKKHKKNKKAKKDLDELLALMEEWDKN